VFEFSRKRGQKFASAFEVRGEGDSLMARGKRQP